MSTDPLTLLAHGKINWTLDVFELRPDGYHEVASIMQRIALADQLTVERAPSGIRLTVTGPEASGVPDDERNIVWKAALLLGVDGVRIELQKRLPSQAGLGGGSSDGAAALRALNKLFELGLTDDQLRSFASELGADVTFFLDGRPSLVGGYGERVTPVHSGRFADLVIIKPDVGVSTAAAYRALNLIEARISRKATAAWPDIEPSNDFEEPVYALYPAVAEAAAALQAAGAAGTLLCGSGAAVFGWGAKTESISEKVRAAGYSRVWQTRTLP